MSIIFLSLNLIKVKQVRFLENFTNSQINISEEREHFFKNIKAHRAKKDISEALEQVHSS